MLYIFVYRFITDLSVHGFHEKIYKKVYFNKPLREICTHRRCDFPIPATEKNFVVVLPTNISSNGGSRVRQSNKAETSLTVSPKDFALPFHITGCIQFMSNLIIM